MPTTPKGFRYPAGTDPNDVALYLQNLATDVDAAPGISTLTTAQRDALPSAGRWDGRIIYNATTTSLQIYKSGGWSELLGVQVVQTFTTSGTWTKLAGALRVKAEMIGGGGGGQSASSSSSSLAAGGGGGGYVSKEFAAADVPSTVPVTVGAGGTGGVIATGSSNPTTGTAGGTSQFGSLLKVTGGAPGGGFTGTDIQGGSGGGVSGGLAVRGSGTAVTTTPSSALGGGAGGTANTANPGASDYGGGGGAQASSGTPNPGGASTFAGAGGQGGGPTGGNPIGQPGAIPGGGGGATWGAAAAGGAGARGVVTVTTYL